MISNPALNDKKIDSKAIQIIEHKLDFLGKKSGDYSRSHKEQGMEIGLCEIQGRRDEQQDYLVASINEVSNLPKLSCAKQTEALEQTFASMQEKCKNDFHCGSTACAAITWIDEKQMLNAKVTNLGDSSAYAIILNKKNKIKRCTRLHTLHKPNDSEEAMRIIQQGGSVETGPFTNTLRLNGDLSLSRSFGDMIHGRVLSHTPDTYLFEEKLEEGDQAFIVVACDGPEEVLTVDDIGNLVKENSLSSCADIARIITMEAYAKGSQDNLSVAVIHASKIAQSAAIFDGHGREGEKVSKKIGESFYSTLKNNIEIQAKNTTPCENKTKRADKNMKQIFLTKENLSLLFPVADPKQDNSVKLNETLKKWIDESNSNKPVKKTSVTIDTSFAPPTKVEQEKNWLDLETDADKFSKTFTSNKVNIISKPRDSKVVEMSFTVESENGDILDLIESLAEKEKLDAYRYKNDIPDHNSEKVLRITFRYSIWENFTSKYNNFIEAVKNQLPKTANTASTSSTPNPVLLFSSSASTASTAADGKSGTEQEFSLM